ncbi:hypothetical protein CURE108131_22975 [Cupriavidus respiraculi]|uniref:Uncharacterized protein n=1 Tax=Cupriavidus respiraculi TaxID=195930 RepID=A0ABN7YK56_9BURK|nr:hypothetical protein [Cupriavidus respiraculi]CAG9172525.1 hypothetical protein LMG21510_02000 [Cupriavidus respiraculi]
MGEFDLEVSERIAERTRDPILRAANAHIRDLEADRDSWRDQASERLKDWVDMRVRAETAEQRIRELEQDAALLDWLAARCAPGPGAKDLLGRHVYVHFMRFPVIECEEGAPLREAITAAMAASAKGGKDAG